MITVLFLHSGVNYLHAFSLIFFETPNTNGPGKCVSSQASVSSKI